VERVNSEGIPREQLIYALTQPKMVAHARRRNGCLLCRAKGVNEAGLCASCIPFLSREELKLMERWMAGVGP
jgi:hypothetical protein